MNNIVLVKRLESQNEFCEVKFSNLLVETAKRIQSLSHVSTLKELHDNTKMVVV